MSSNSLLSLLGGYSGLPQQKPGDGWAARVNGRVATRFGQFASRLVVTPRQREEAMKKVAGIVQCLNREYYGSDSETAHAIVEGSWGKGTESRPPRDVDVIFVLPNETWGRFEAREGNKQSQLLQEIKATLTPTYWATKMRADGQVVTVDFANDHGVEVVPAFAWDNGQYLICDTKNDGRFKVVDPHAEILSVQLSDMASAWTTRELIRMVKRWQWWCNVDDLKSFQIDLLVTDFLPTVTYGLTLRGLYDYLIRDFFGYLLSRKNTYVYVPGTGTAVWLGNGWESRAHTAYDRAVKASNFEEREMPISAGAEWQKIFGTDIS